MSSLIVEVCAIEEIKAHPNADRLEMARVKGWWCVVPKEQYNAGDKVVYVPPDSVVPEKWAEHWGIAKYLSPLARGIDGERPPGLRVRACRFRGEKSFGTIQNLEDKSWDIGHDVKDFFGITKYEPPVKAMDGDAAPPVPAFHEYTDIENIQNFPNIFKEGEMVYVDEKIHGGNCRIGLINHPDETTGQLKATFMCGSHGTRRKKENENGVQSKYWIPYNDPGVVKMLEVIYCDYQKANIVVFGELFGPGIQDMHYGQKGLAFRAFDISVDGKYLDYQVKQRYFDKYNVQTVPFLYYGPFSQEKMDELVDGPTFICEASEIKEPFKGREGIVIRPEKERYDFDLGGSGRVILKYVSVDYHERKNKDQTEDH